jgi:predicted transcriptional regulator
LAKTERLFIRVTADLKEQLQALAESENRNLSNFIENILIKRVEERSRWQKLKKKIEEESQE